MFLTFIVYKSALTIAGVVPHSSSGHKWISNRLLMGQSSVWQYVPALGVSECVSWLDVGTFYIDLVRSQEATLKPEQSNGLGSAVLL